MKTFVREMCVLDPSLNDGFFTVKAGGKLDLGIGSANAEKFLARLEGPTSAPDNDVVLEAKALRTAGFASCMREISLDATRVESAAQMQMSCPRPAALSRRNDNPGQALLHARVAGPVHGALGRRHPQRGGALRGIAEDVGLQLGRGHAKTKDPANVARLRSELRDAAKRIEPDVVNESYELAVEVSSTWRRFRAALPPP